MHIYFLKLLFLSGKNVFWVYAIIPFGWTLNYYKPTIEWFAGKFLGSQGQKVVYYILHQVCMSDHTLELLNFPEDGKNENFTHAVWEFSLHR